MKIVKLLTAIAITSLGISTLKTPQVIAAEKVTLSLPVLGEFSLSVAELELFARSGEIKSSTYGLGLIAKFIDDKSLQQFSKILKTSFVDDPVLVHRLTNTPIGEDVLKRIGNLIYTHPQRNGIYAIRAGLIQAAAEPEGLTVLNFLHHFPSEKIQLNAKLAYSIVRELDELFDYKKTTQKAIAAESEREIASSKLNLANLTDLSQPGKYRVRRRQVTFAIDSPRQTAKGFTGDYQLNVELHLPTKLDRPAPLALIAHGFGANSSDYDKLAKHLASHGYIVAMPEHGGSSNNYQKAFLRGEVGVDISPIEFYSRPRDITHLLNKLEQNPDWQQQINWSQVGIIGHSLGGTTALLNAGAALNWDRIQDVCQQDDFILNVSIFLQCRAKNLPPGNYNLQDDRIQAVMVLNPIGSAVLGQESIEDIKIPVLIVGGTQDFIAPYVDEQVHPFLWLSTKHKYLATVVGGGHTASSAKNSFAGVGDALQGSNSNLNKNYFKTLSLAFFETHVRDRQQYKPYLTAAYAKNISQPELPLNLITSLTAEQLELAYGDTPPIDPLPKSTIANIPQNRNVLKEIEQTGVLSIAMRTDAAPFSSRQNDDDLWDGYCSDLADTLGKQLTEKLNRTTPITVEKIPSSFANRFELVQQKVVHLECGSNSIVPNKEGVTFSDPFFASGTRLLVKSNDVAEFDFVSKLSGMKLGVLGQTTTKEFLEQNYPDATIVNFDDANSRYQGIKAIANGELDAFVSEDVLLTGELDRQGIEPKNYQTIPEHPLSCEYYGLILPEDDPQWRITVNAFIRDRPFKQVFDKWLTPYYAQSVADLDYCQNRRNL